MRQHARSRLGYSHLDSWPKPQKRHNADNMTKQTVKTTNKSERGSTALFGLSHLPWFAAAVIWLSRKAIWHSVDGGQSLTYLVYLVSAIPPCGTGRRQLAPSHRQPGLVLDPAVSMSRCQDVQRQVPYVYWYSVSLPVGLAIRKLGSDGEDVR